MFIRYGTSRVGSLASWVSYPPMKKIPTPLSPKSTITDSTPTYTWSKLNGATKYQYQLYQENTLIYAKSVPASVCGSSTCSHTPSEKLSAGNYRWRVCAYINGVWYSCSAFLNFTLINPIPSPIFPSGSIGSTNPTYSWSVIPTATRYQYQVYKGGTLLFAKTLSSTSICNSSTCSHTPTEKLSVGTYRWRVCAYLDGIWRSSSPFQDFSVSFVPTPISPSGTINTNLPAYMWGMIIGATKYQYQLYQENTRLTAQTVSANVCTNNICTFTPAVPLSAGEYRWRVCAYINNIWYSTSSFLNFSIPSR